MENILKDPKLMKEFMLKNGYVSYHDSTGVDKEGNEVHRKYFIKANGEEVEV